MSLFDDSGGSLLDSLSQVATTGASVYNTVTGQPATAPTSTAAPAKTNWLLVGGIGAAVLVVLMFVLGKK